MKRYKIIEIKENCVNKECHITEYHDGYVDCNILCKINNEVCNEENCNHKELQLDGFTKEEMIEKMATALCQKAKNTEDCQLCSICWEEGCNRCDFSDFAEAALDALLSKGKGNKK